jgi:hypothetical protein
LKGGRVEILADGREKDKVPIKKSGRSAMITPVYACPICGRLDMVKNGTDDKGRQKYHCHEYDRMARAKRPNPLLRKIQGKCYGPIASGPVCAGSNVFLGCAQNFAEGDRTSRQKITRGGRHALARAG